MNNQSGQPEKVAAFRQPEIEQAPVVPSGDAIVDFHTPRHRPSALTMGNPTSITTTVNQHLPNIVEGLFDHKTSDSGIGDNGQSKAEARAGILNMALHRSSGAKKAA